MVFSSDSQSPSMQIEATRSPHSSASPDALQDGDHEIYGQPIPLSMMEEVEDDGLDLNESKEGMNDDANGRSTDSKAIRGHRVRGSVERHSMAPNAVKTKWRNAVHPENEDDRALNEMAERMREHEMTDHGVVGTQGGFLRVHRVYTGCPCSPCGHCCGSLCDILMVLLAIMVFVMVTPIAVQEAAFNPEFYWNLMRYQLDWCWQCFCEWLNPILVTARDDAKDMVHDVMT